MRFYRYLVENGQPGWAMEKPEGVFQALRGNPFDGYETGAPMARPLTLLAPVVPRAIIGIALNYRAHAAETGKPAPERPIFFLKLPGAVQNPGDPIRLPRKARSEAVDYEAELAVVIGRRCRNASLANALEYVAGYTAANDVSARDWQYQWGGGQFCRAKTFDTFCPLGPCLVTPDEIPEPGRLNIRCRVNGEERQNSSTADLIFSVPELIVFLSASTTLEPGTVILTGTPSGVGHACRPPRYLQPGDRVEVEIEKIGILANPVEEESEL